MTPLTHTERTELVVDVLPMTLRRTVDLMHDADVRMAFEGIVPIPAGTMRISVCKSP